MFTRLSKALALIALPFSIGVNPLHAQTFVSPSAYEFTYNAHPVEHSDEVSCFAFRDPYTSTAWGNVDVYLAGYGTGVSEVTIQFTKPGDPTTIVHQEGIRYDDACSFSVGAVYNAATGNTQILVAYEWAGFKIDVYDITSSPTNPVVFNNTIYLTPAVPTTFYFGNRIRLDCLSTDLRTAAAVWDNGGNGLQSIACKDGIWSPIADLDNTIGERNPDIAMTDDGAGNRLVRYVHHNNAGTAITTSVIDFGTLYTAGGTAFPSIEDVNNITVPIGSRPVLDCRDVDGWKNWAYTYTDLAHQEAFVRLVYNGASPTPYTVNVTDGSMGNASIVGQYEVYTPTIHYGAGHYAGDEIMVGWYVTNGGYNGYIGLKMKPDGMGVISNPDYLELPNATTPGAYPTPYMGMAFSKSDIDLTPEYMYAVYYNDDGGVGFDILHHAFHRWGNSVFRKELQTDLPAVSVYPNPFSDELSTTVTLAADSKVRVELVDVIGRTVAHKESRQEEGTQLISLRGLQNIISGTYFLNTIVDGKRVSTRTVIKK